MDIEKNKKQMQTRNDNFFKTNNVTLLQSFAAYTGHLELEVTPQDCYHEPAKSHESTPTSGESCNAVFP